MRLDQWDYVLYQIEVSAEATDVQPIALGPQNTHGWCVTGKHTRLATNNLTSNFGLKK